MKFDYSLFNTMFNNDAQKVTISFLKPNSFIEKAEEDWVVTVK